MVIYLARQPVLVLLVQELRNHGVNLALDLKLRNMSSFLDFVMYCRFISWHIAKQTHDKYHS